MGKFVRQSKGIMVYEDLEHEVTVSLRPTAYPYPNWEIRVKGRPMFTAQFQGNLYDAMEACRKWFAAQRNVWITKNKFDEAIANHNNGEIPQIKEAPGGFGQAAVLEYEPVGYIRACGTNSTDIEQQFQALPTIARAMHNLQVPDDYTSKGRFVPVGFTKTFIVNGAPDIRFHVRPIVPTKPGWIWQLFQAGEYVLRSSTTYMSSVDAKATVDALEVETGGVEKGWQPSDYLYRHEDISVYRADAANGLWQWDIYSGPVRLFHVADNSLNPDPFDTMEQVRQYFSYYDNPTYHKWWADHGKEGYPALEIHDDGERHTVHVEYPNDCYIHGLGQTLPDFRKAFDHLPAIAEAMKHLTINDPLAFLQDREACP